MRNLKAMKRILTIVILTIFFLTSCNDDKNPTKQSNTDPTGTWKLTKLTIVSDQTVVLNELMLAQLGAYWTLELKSDKTFISNYNLDEPATDTGTWNVSGEQLTTTFDSGGSETFDFFLDQEVLTLEWTAIEEGVQEMLTGEFAKQ
ncbi:MAG: lipocalin family protein [Deferribacteres bacterium]|nr:lipocalin family protein [candidate division KSB1 bacterium]MCB9503514.1 lipocalin family protein [Deferribacteres bacterium]